jgi:hypothetical protein
MDRSHFNWKTYDGISEYIASITPGIYNSDNIVTTVKTAIEATGFGGTVTVIFSENTYMLTIASTVNFGLQFETYGDSLSHFVQYFRKLSKYLYNGKHIHFFQ